ncbi:unnamed protein product [Victoria cruziana]
MLLEDAESRLWLLLSISEPPCSILLFFPLPLLGRRRCGYRRYGIVYISSGPVLSSFRFKLFKNDSQHRIIFVQGHYSTMKHPEKNWKVVIWFFCCL